MKNQVLYIFAGLVLLINYQNCAPASFDSLPSSNLDQFDNCATRPSECSGGGFGPSIQVKEAPGPLLLTNDNARLEVVATPGSSEIKSIRCGFEGQLVSCSNPITETFSDQRVSDYKYLVEVTDENSLTAITQIEWRVSFDSFEHRQNIEVNSNNKADILVVIDNSGSMKHEQSSMAQRFGSFINQLSSLDWQLGIATTDPTNSTYGDGRLVTMREGRGLPAYSFINKAVPNYSAVFANSIQRSEQGSGYEQGIRTTYRALQRYKDKSNNANTAHWSFFRPDAVLSVIVVSDADETPNGSPEARNNPNNLLNFVKSTFPNKAFSFHSIVVKTGDTACLNSDLNEGYGTNYEKLSSLTGGVIGSVCASNYGAQLAQIGNATVDLVKTVNLDCEPLDINDDGKPDVSVYLANGKAAPSFKVTGQKIEFASLLPTGKHEIRYECLR